MIATTYTVKVEKDKAGARLDRVLAEALPELSRTRVQSLIRNGHVAGNGPPVVNPDFRVEAGSIWRIEATPLPAPVVTAEAIPLDVVFEDDDLIVVDKPAGLVVHPGAGNPHGTLVNALLRHCRGELARAGGLLRPGIVHRLDKDTSGLIVAAKTDAAYRSLVGQFAAHSIERGYYALVHGVPCPAQGRIEGAIGRSPVDRKKMALTTSGGKGAATDYRVVRTFKAAASLVECRPLTGRTHQIRVHLTSLGHPLIGDPLYGRRKPRPGHSLPAAVAAALDRQALHAFLIAFDHPTAGWRLCFRSRMPVDMKGLICELEQL
ncbi:MAG TPA: RluA family pseudouridine synthase [Rhodospirillales bacterium]|nr:RluA family pseudouridine synthase [Rhodospirillales bacterium]